MRGLDPRQSSRDIGRYLVGAKWPQGRPWNGSEFESVPKTTSAPTFRITKSTPSDLRGRRRGRCSMVCQVAGSISRMRRSTDTCWRAAANKLALRWIGRDDRIRDFSYAALRAQTNRFANILAQHGVAKGDRVFSLLGRSARTLHRRSRHAQEWQRVLALVLGVRTRSHQGPYDDRQCQSACHFRSIIPAQDRALAQGTREPGARLLDGLFEQPSRRARSI